MTYILGISSTNHSSGRVSKIPVVTESKAYIRTKFVRPLLTEIWDPMNKTSELPLWTGWWSFGRNGSGSPAGTITGLQLLSPWKRVTFSPHYVRRFPSNYHEDHLELSRCGRPSAFRSPSPHTNHKPSSARSSAGPLPSCVRETSPRSV